MNKCNIQMGHPILFLVEDFFSQEMQKSVNLSAAPSPIGPQGCDETIHTQLLKTEQSF